MGLFDFMAGAPAGSPTSYQGMEARRRIALQLLANSRKGYPKTIGEGLTAVGDAIGDRAVLNQLAAQEAAYQKQAGAIGAGLIPEEARTPGPQSENTTQDTPVRTAYAPTADVQASTVAPADRTITPAVTQMPVRTADLTPDEQAAGVQGSGANALDAASAVDPWGARSRAIAGIESGGARDPYSTLGTQTRTGDRAYGKYQVMGANIPEWTKTATGTALTPQQFLANKAAQEATFRSKFGDYVDKYGDQGAARAWFGGEGGMNNLGATDAYGRLNVGQYGQDYINRFNAGGGRDAIAAQMAARQTAGGPQPNPTQPGAGPSAALPLSALAPTSGSDLPPEILTGASAIRPAPPPPSQIQAAPVQVAQAQPPQGARVVIPSQRVPLPQDVPMTADEKRGWNAMPTARALGDPGMIAAAQALIDRGAAERQQRYNLIVKDWQDQVLAKRQRDLLEEQRAYEAPEREQRMAKAKQEMEQSAIAPPPPGPPPQQVAGPGVPTGDPRLGTPQSPQRTGVPAAPPIPPGISPQQHAAQQAPLLTQAVQAEQKATPEFQRSLQLIKELGAHPGKDWGLGIAGKTVGQVMPEAIGFRQRLEQIQGKTFLQAYQTLKGGGSITEIEGSKATQALARLNAANSKTEFDAALNDLENTMRSDLELAQRKVNKPVTAWQNTPNDRYAPDVGQRGIDKKTGKLQEYLGGNPALDTSYRDVN